MKDKKSDFRYTGKPIDAVITWVDGNDPKHKAKVNKYLKQEDIRFGTALPTYFAEVGEFEYCVLSVLLFAPWLRNIFIVSDDQRPSFSDKIADIPGSEKIQIIDHKIIFSGYETVLPTFNSRSIVTMLWRIPDLAERYIIFNDDIILLRPIYPEIFFQENKLTVRGRWRAQYEYRFDKKIARFFGNKIRIKPAARPGYRTGQAKAAKIAGFHRRYFSVAHYPHPQLKSLLQEFFAEHPQLMENNIRYRIRSGKQFLAESLNLHLALKQSLVHTDKKKSGMTLKIPTTSYMRLRIQLLWAKYAESVKFLCIQNLDRADKRKRELIMKMLYERVAKPLRKK